MIRVQKRKWLHLLAAAAVAACGVLLYSSAGSAADPAAEAPRELVFVPVKVDGPVHAPANHTYWFGPFAECGSVLDIDGDGKLDIAAGRNYYLAPNWTKYADYRDGAEANGPDVDDNYEGTMDVNNDGRPDVLSSGWMRRQGIWWYENPGKGGVKWNSHQLHAADGLEGMVIGNLSGRSDKDVLVNYFARKPGRGLIWFEHIDQAPWFKQHVLGPENVGVSHGNGIGDINGDGRNDVVTTSGWFEAPLRPTEDQWIWHPDYQFTAYGAAGRPGGAGLPILVADVDGDGRNDIIIGSDHGYGLAWYQQKMENGKRSFLPHWIETAYPTIHTMALADLDGDGKPELITGKQLFAHNGADVGGFEPVFVFYYKFNKGRFERHIVSYSYLMPYFGPGADNTPAPNYVVGLGMRFQVADMDGDGRLDIVIPCKTGLYIFYNKGHSSMTRGTNYLPDRTTYPSHKEWEAPRPPRAQPDAEGFTTLFNGRDLSSWQPATHWAVENGVLVLKDRTDRQEHNDNYLWTQQQYRDFVLDLEFKAEQGTNSGIFLRTANPKDPVQTGIEVQVAASAAGRPPGKGSLGALYDLVTPKALTFKAGDWNRYTITCDGGKISVVLNGQLASEADLDQWTEARKNPDGTPNKFETPLKDFARTGYVGLQDHGTRVSYRNIRIKPLNTGRKLGRAPAGPAWDKLQLVSRCSGEWARQAKAYPTREPTAPGD